MSIKAEKLIGGFSARPSVPPPGLRAGFLFTFTAIPQNVAQRSQDLVSFGHRNGHHPAARAEAPRVVMESRKQQTLAPAPHETLTFERSFS